MSISHTLVRRSNARPEARPAVLVEGCAEMSVKEQIEQYISDQPASKREEIRELQRLILKASPSCKLWFLDGRDSDGKIVSNPNIGFGSQTQNYASGETREFYQIGLSANSTGISVYVMGIEDKAYLPRTYGAKLGKAKITGYCVKFRHVKDIDIAIFEEMVATHMAGGPRVA
jgi:hypothetical protein